MSSVCLFSSRKIFDERWDPRPPVKEFYTSREKNFDEKETQKTHLTTRAVFAARDVEPESWRKTRSPCEMAAESQKRRRGGPFGGDAPRPKPQSQKEIRRRETDDTKINERLTEKWCRRSREKKSAACEAESRRRRKAPPRKSKRASEEEKRRGREKRAASRHPIFETRSEA